MGAVEVDNITLDTVGEGNLILQTLSASSILNNQKGTDDTEPDDDQDTEKKKRKKRVST